MIPVRSEITLYPFSNVTHLKQLFCGFRMLARGGTIRLSSRFDGPRLFHHRVANEKDSDAYVLMARYGNHGMLCYDVHDSDRVIDGLYGQCDLYFKRSFDPAVHGKLAKMRPLGLNFPVDTPGVDFDGAVRAVMIEKSLRRMAAEVLRALKLPPVFAATPDVFDARRPEQPARILFLTQTWDPAESYDQSPEKRQGRQTLNEFRAATIRALKRAFPGHFFGGFSPTPYTLGCFRDLAVDDARLTRRATYLSLVDQYAICVTSKGLHDSTGWKFAEYLAKGRAIVTEKMRFLAGGDLALGTHYLDFGTPEECVERVGALVTNVELRMQMMAASRRYYEKYVRPDSLVLNTLTEANGALAGGLAG